MFTIFGGKSRKRQHFDFSQQFPIIGEKYPKNAMLIISKMQKNHIFSQNLEKWNVSIFLPTLENWWWGFARFKI